MKVRRGGGGGGLACDVFDTYATHASLVFDVDDTDWELAGGVFQIHQIWYFGHPWQPCFWCHWHRLLDTKWQCPWSSLLNFQALIIIIIISFLTNNIRDQMKNCSIYLLFNFFSSILKNPLGPLILPWFVSPSSLSWDDCGWQDVKVQVITPP